MRIRILGQYGNSALLYLWVTEFCALLAASWLAYWVRGDALNGIAAWLQPVSFALTGTFGLIAMGLYSPRQRDRVPLVLVRVALAMVLSSIAAILLAAIVREGHFNARTQLATAVLSWGVIVVLRLWIMRLVPDKAFKRRVMVFGCGSRANAISRLRRRSDRRGFEIVAYLACDGEVQAVPAGNVFRTKGSILETATAYGIDEIVVAMDDRRQGFPGQQLLDCRMAGIDVIELIAFLERESGKLHVDLLNTSWLVFSGGFRHDAFRRISERSFDVLVSSSILAICWPFMLLVALAIKLEDGWGAPVLYRQQRVGYGGRVFDLIKFRSMQLDAEKDGHAVWASANDARVTCVGALIRKIRLDELPQLLTVLKGKMSFVGPRPERPEFVERLAAAIPFYRERHFVKPGLTGWAQVCYRYGASERDALEKLQYDLFYVKNHTLLFDCLILVQTVEVILLGRGGR